MMATGGPDDDTWQKMSKGARLAYYLFVGSIVCVIIVLALLRF